MKSVLEIIAFNIQSCVIAEVAGAHRIELCDNPGEGGTTPSHGFIKAARRKLKIPLYAMIRPRGGDFLYSQDEFEIMMTDVTLSKDLGCDGIVIGMLNEDATIDKKRAAKLVNLAYPMGVTFHRAFDRVIDPLKALEDVIEIGCERILTSGLRATAIEGAENIRQLIVKADERIIIMPGSGVRADNIAGLAVTTAAVEFHSSARIMIGSKMEGGNSDMNESMQTISVDENEIKAMLTNHNAVRQ